MPTAAISRARGAAMLLIITTYAYYWRAAQKAGLSLGSTGGITVTPFMQTSDPDIYAGGDCVESRHLVTGKPALFPMGSAANKQGRAAGANAMGRRIRVEGFTPLPLP